MTDIQALHSRLRQARQSGLNLADVDLHQLQQVLEDNMVRTLRSPDPRMLDRADPETSSLERIDRLQQYYLNVLVEDPQDGTALDCDILDMLKALKLKHRPPTKEQDEAKALDQQIEHIRVDLKIACQCLDKAYERDMKDLRHQAEVLKEELTRRINALQKRRADLDVPPLYRTQTQDTLAFLAKKYGVQT